MTREAKRLRFLADYRMVCRLAKQARLAGMVEEAMQYEKSIDDYYRLAYSYGVSHDDLIDNELEMQQ
jgi:hypothetical protein